MDVLVARENVAAIWKINRPVQMNEDQVGERSFVIVFELATVHGGVKERPNSREESVVPRQLPNLRGSAGLEHRIADKQRSGML
jgi:hypothetical protein